MAIVANYYRHEEVYAQDPAKSGWNSAVVDAQMLLLIGDLLVIGGIQPPARVLEIGSGMGNLGVPLATIGYEVIGIDISPTAVSAANERLSQQGLSGRASFRVGDVTSADAYQDIPAADCVLDSLCLHCIIGSDRAKLLSNVVGSLKPAGKFVLLTMCGDPCNETLRARFDPRSRYIVDGSVANRYLGYPGEILDELRNAGLAVTYDRVIAGSADGGQDMLVAVAQRT
jgi:SAM-dependent methyltransferase